MKISGAKVNWPETRHHYYQACQQIEIKNCSEHSEVSHTSYTYQHPVPLKQTSNNFLVKISVKMNVYVLYLRKAGSHKEIL